MMGAPSRPTLVLLPSGSNPDEVISDFSAVGVVFLLPSQELERTFQAAADILVLDPSEADPPGDQWLSLPGASQLLSSLKSSLGALNGPTVVPARFAKLYRQAFSELGSVPRYVLFVDHPSHIVAQTGRGHQPPHAEHEAGKWLTSVLAAFQDCEGTEFLVVVAPLEQTPLDRLTAALDVPAGKAPDRAGPMPLSDWPSIVARTYDLAVRAQSDPASVQSDIDQIAKEANHLADMIKPIALPGGQVLLSWREGTKIGQASLKYSPTGLWQTITVPAKPPAGTIVQIDLYQMPCRVWIRRAVWRAGRQEQPAMLNAGPSGLIENKGMARVTVAGPAALLAKAPSWTEESELELEVLIQTGPRILKDIAGMLRASVDAALRAPANSGGFRH